MSIEHEVMRCREAPVAVAEELIRLRRENVTLKRWVVQLRAALRRLWDEIKNDYVADVWGRKDQKLWVEETLSSTRFTKEE